MRGVSEVRGDGSAVARRLLVTCRRLKDIESAHRLIPARDSRQSALGANDASVRKASSTVQFGDAEEAGFVTRAGS